MANDEKNSDIKGGIPPPLPSADDTKAKPAPSPPTHFTPEEDELWQAFSKIFKIELQEQSIYWRMDTKFLNKPQFIHNLRQLALKARNLKKISDVEYTHAVDFLNTYILSSGAFAPKSQIDDKANDYSLLYGSNKILGEYTKNRKQAKIAQEAKQREEKAYLPEDDFEKQFFSLLDKLDEWGQGEQKIYITELKNKLFTEAFSGLQNNNYFSQLKLHMEQMFFLLNNNQIPLEYRKTIYNEFCHHFYGICCPGLPSHVSSYKNKLDSYVNLSLKNLLSEYRTALLTEYAGQLHRKIYKDYKDNNIGNQIHTVNDILDFAQQRGCNPTIDLKAVVDNFIDHRNINEKDKWVALRFLNEHYTPVNICEFIRNKLEELIIAKMDLEGLKASPDHWLPVNEEFLSWLKDKIKAIFGENIELTKLFEITDPIVDEKGDPPTPYLRIKPNLYYLSKQILIIGAEEKQDIFDPTALRSDFHTYNKDTFSFLKNYYIPVPLNPISDKITFEHWTSLSDEELLYLFNKHIETIKQHSIFIEALYKHSMFSGKVKTLIRIHDIIHPETKLITLPYKLNLIANDSKLEDIKPAPNNIYVKKTDKMIEYTVINPFGKKVIAKIDEKEPDGLPLVQLEEKNSERLLPLLLDYTAKKGHTQNSMTYDLDRLKEYKIDDWKQLNDDDSATLLDEISKIKATPSHFIDAMAMDAVQKDKPKLLKNLMTRDKELANRSFEYKKDTRASLLYIGAMNGAFNTVDTLLTETKQQNMYQPYGKDCKTPVNIAAENNRPKTLQSFLKHDPKLLRHPSNVHLLIDALNNKANDAADAILERLQKDEKLSDYLKSTKELSKKIGAVVHPKLNLSALDIVVLNQDIERIKKIYRTPGSEELVDGAVYLAIESKANPSLRALITCGIKNHDKHITIAMTTRPRNYAALDMLLEALPDLSSFKIDDSSLLHTAIADNDQELLDILLKDKHRTKVNFEEKNRGNVIQYMSDNFYKIYNAKTTLSKLITAGVRFPISANQDIDIKKQTDSKKVPLFQEVLNNSPNIFLPLLIKHPDYKTYASTKDNNNHSFLWHAVDIPDYAVLAELLKPPIQFDLDELDEKGQTVLRKAVRRNELESTEMLLKAGAEAKIAGNDPKKPLLNIVFDKIFNDDESIEKKGLELLELFLPYKNRIGWDEKIFPDNQTALQFYIDKVNHISYNPENYVKINRLIRKLCTILEKCMINDIQTFNKCMEREIHIDRLFITIIFNTDNNAFIKSNFKSVIGTALEKQQFDIILILARRYPEQLTQLPAATMVLLKSHEKLKSLESPLTKLAFMPKAVTHSDKLLARQLQENKPYDNLDKLLAKARTQLVHDGYRTKVPHDDKHFPEFLLSAYELGWNPIFDEKQLNMPLDKIQLPHYFESLILSEYLEKNYTPQFIINYIITTLEQMILEQSRGIPPSALNDWLKRFMKENLYVLVDPEKMYSLVPNKDKKGEAKADVKNTDSTIKLNHVYLRGILINHLCQSDIFDEKQINKYRVIINGRQYLKSDYLPLSSSVEILKRWNDVPEEDLSTLMQSLKKEWDSANTSFFMKSLVESSRLNYDRIFDTLFQYAKEHKNDNDPRFAEEFDHAEQSRFMYCAFLHNSYKIMDLFFNKYDNIINPPDYYIRLITDKFISDKPLTIEEVEGFGRFLPLEKLDNVIEVLKHKKIPKEKLDSFISCLNKLKEYRQFEEQKPIFAPNESKIQIDVYTLDRRHCAKTIPFYHTLFWNRPRDEKQQPLQLAADIKRIHNDFERKLNKQIDCTLLPFENVIYSALIKESKPNVDELALLFSVAADVAELRKAWIAKNIDQRDNGRITMTGILSTLDRKFKPGSKISLKDLENEISKLSTTFAPDIRNEYVNKLRKILAFRTLETDVQNALSKYPQQTCDQVIKTVIQILDNAYKPGGAFENVPKGFFDDAASLMSKLSNRMKNANYKKDVIMKLLASPPAAPGV